MSDTTLGGVSVLVAGAGLAGLAAARDLMALGATVTVIDVRDRVGGRVWTIREGFAEGQHAEAGGDFIDEDQHEIRNLATELGLKLTRILKGGFGYVRPDQAGRAKIITRNAKRGWERLAHELQDVTRPYNLAERRWDSPITAELARRSVAAWLDQKKADAELRATATGLRGFFLADPDELSLLALVDQFSDSDAPAPGTMYRVDGGNDRLTAALAEPLGDRLHLNTDVVAISHRGKVVRVSVKNNRALAQINCDYAILALPATLLRRMPITPALPAQQHEAIVRLKYGRATKTLLQFSKRFWRAAGRPRAFGSPLPFGAVWDGNEEQPSRRTRQPRAQRRIELRIEIGVAAARIRILFPDNLPRRHQLAVFRSQPVERVGEPARAVLGDNRLGRVAGAAAGEQRQDAGAAALFFVAVPDGAEGQR